MYVVAIVVHLKEKELYKKSLPVSTKIQNGDAVFHKIQLQSGQVPLWKMRGLPRLIVLEKVCGLCCLVWEWPSLGIESAEALSIPFSETIALEAVL